MARLLFLAIFLLTIICHQTSSQQCYVPGICNGQLLGSLESHDRYQCLSACSGLRDCTWFSSHEEDGFCGLFQTCDEVSTEDCPQCVSGEYSCAVLRCNLEGECQGTFLAEDSTTSEVLCQDFCKSHTGCAFYTFHESTGVCLLFEDCPELNNCPSCVSGQPGCYVDGQTTETPPLTSTLPETSTTESNGGMEVYIFVVGGDIVRGAGGYSTEIVSLTEGDSIPDCLDALSDHPNPLFYAAGGALLMDDGGYKPHTCGSSYYPRDECWFYRPSDNTWIKKFFSIPRYIDQAASAFHPAWGIIMSGGSEIETEVTITEDAEYFKDLEPMPYGSKLHCVAAIDANTIFVTGLGTFDDESYTYDRDTKEWYYLPNMPTGRLGMGCGVVRDDSGNVEVVVVGGERFGVVEIFNIEENSWRQASNPLPTGTAIRYPSIAQHDNTFFVIGGEDDNGNLLDTIYRYEASDESWQLMPNGMKFSRAGATSMMVNASIFPSCD